MDVTACISIWVKNLANVANVAGWVRRKEATWVGWVPVCLLFCLLVGLCTCLALLFAILSQFPPCPNVSKLLPKYILHSANTLKD